MFVETFLQRAAVVVVPPSPDELRAVPVDGFGAACAGPNQGHVAGAIGVGVPEAGHHQLTLVGQALGRAP